VSDRVHVVMPAGVRDPARPSGGNLYDVRVCSGLAGRGWSVHEHEVVGSWPRPDAVALSELGEVLESVADGDAVLVDGLVGSAAPECLAAHTDRLRLVLLVHMPLDDDRERQALAAVDVAVVTSAWTRDRLLDAYGFDGARVRVAEPGTDPAPLVEGSEGGRRLLAVGPVSSSKGHDTLVAALQRLADVDWELDLVGSLDVDPGTAEGVLTWAERSGGRVRVHGPLRGSRLQAAYASADLLVHPSRAETYGMVLTEALARGIPVVTSDVGGTREALGMADRVGGAVAPGLLVAPGDVDALATALRAWLTDAGARRRLRAAARERRRDLPSWDATVVAVDEAVRSAALVGARR
jgi:glycosyltransferase involved in cell wall biosynthesis